MRGLYVILATMTLTVNAYGQSSVSIQPQRGPAKDVLPMIPTREIGPAFKTSVLNDTTSLDSVIYAHMSANHIPGLAACIVKNNRVAWEGYYGYANLARNIPVSSNTMFMLASISKTVMATALMQLHEQGRFQLDDSINAFLPFPVRNPKYPTIPITFRMLLTHTSSITDDPSIYNTYAPGDPIQSLESFLQEHLVLGAADYDARKSFLPVAPGTYWEYSNTGATLAGFLVEVISGVPFDKYCTDHIFNPLQMTNTAWFLKDLDTTLIAHPYKYSDASGQYFDYGLYGFPYYACGQLRTTALSLSRFLIAHMKFGCLGNVRLLDSSTVRLLRTVQYPSINLDQGLIWYIEQRDLFGGLELWGHTGLFYGVSTSMYLSESDTVGIIVLQNAYAARLPVILKLLQVADTLTVDPLAAPQLVSPASLSNVPRRTTPLWHSSRYATQYHVQVSMDTEFVAVERDTVIADTTLKLSSSLMASRLYYWHVSAIGTEGESPFSSVEHFTTGLSEGVAGDGSALPREFALLQNYPNPFNPSTTIEYQIPKQSFVMLKIFDLLGREVANVVNESKAPGSYSARFDANSLASGVYFYKLTAGEFVQTKKMVLMK